MRKPQSTVYTGKRAHEYDHAHHVLVEELTLRLNDSLEVIAHSPTGFEWGFSGSGPAQLALAILLDYAGEAVARSRYQDFKSEVVAKWYVNSWRITGAEIDQWLMEQALTGEGGAR